MLLFRSKAILRSFRQYCFVFGSSSSSFGGGPVRIFHSQSGYSESALIYFKELAYDFNRIDTDKNEERDVYLYILASF